MSESRIFLFVKALIWQIAVWCLTALVLFLSAGTFTWMMGWIFFTFFFCFVLFLSSWLFIHDANLLEERLTILKADQPVWDRLFLICFYLLSLFWLALMPLDAVRLHWSRMPLWAASIGILFLLAALFGIFVTISANHYLSPVVRLQAGQTVISSGPYAHIRHPLYASAFLFYVSVPLLLGSWIGLVCAPVFIGLMIYRAVQEECLLRDGLPGYNVYLTKVKHRFIPKIW